jgi:hypothetical protein
MTDQQLPVAGQDLRDRAIARLKQKRDFGVHLFVYLVVNSFLIGIWAFTRSWLLLAGVPAVRLGHRAGAERLGRVLAQAPVRGPDPPRDGADSVAP